MSSSTAFSGIAARVREFMQLPADAGSSLGGAPLTSETERFGRLALDLFALQYAHNMPFKRFSGARSSSPETVRHWTEIPAVPAAAFKELDFSCLRPEERTAVFHSSGTTGQSPSRHFHHTASLALYEDSLWSWFSAKVPASRECRRLLSLTPSPRQAPHSSLVYMVETIRRRLSLGAGEFLGKIAADNSWALDENLALEALVRSVTADVPVLMFGTAFAFLYLVEFLQARRISINLPGGSQVFETGGYKGRARALPKSQLHALLWRHLGISSGQIVCEYGMSELSSQAYETLAETGRAPGVVTLDRSRIFHFPPWARARILSPETGAEVNDGETGLVCVFDLANVYSVMAIQTEDLGVRHGTGFELLGRAVAAEPRGCSLMAAG